MMTYDKMFIKSVIVIDVLNKNTSKSFTFWIVRHIGTYMQRNCFFENKKRKIITVCLLL